MNNEVSNVPLGVIVLCAIVNVICTTYLFLKDGFTTLVFFGILYFIGTVILFKLVKTKLDRKREGLDD